MILKYDLPKQVMSLITLQPGERIYYAIPYDIDEDGTWLTDSYLVVTTNNIWVIKKGTVKRQILINECRHIKAEAKVGGGLLTLTYKEVPQLVVHYSAKHLSRYAYVARGINILASGRDEEVISTDYEKICPKCGRAIPGTRYCPHCSKEGGFFKTFIPILTTYKLKLIGIVVLMFLAAVVTLLNPEVQKYLVDHVLSSEHGKISTAFICLGIMFALSAGIVVINILKSYYCTVYGATIARDLRTKLFAKVQILSLGFINERRPGELMNRITFDTVKVREFMERTFCNMFTVSFIFVCDIIYMLVLNVKLALLAFIFIPIVVAITYGFRKVIHRRFHLQYKKNDDVNSDLQDVISGMRVVKSYGKEAHEEEKFNYLSDTYCHVQKKNEVFWAVFMPMVRFVMSAGVYLVIYFGGIDVLDGTMTTGELLQFFTYTQLLYQYLQWMTDIPRALTSLISSLERINDILMQEPFISDVDQPLDLELQGEIEFKNATFGYKSYQPVLEDLNLKIKKGEMIGVVLQENFLFSGTILNNIRFARPDATYEEVIMAAKMANAHDFISKTPDGYNTYVGEKGSNLSGGERQRIAIARAILNNPKLLILDEATASLDTESEFMIQKALDRLTNGRTTFAIAHRLSTLQNADRLLVIDGHSIAEVGTHEELIRQHGIYYNLVNAQLKMQETKAV